MESGFVVVGRGKRGRRQVLNLSGSWALKDVVGEGEAAHLALLSVRE